MTGVTRRILSSMAGITACLLIGGCTVIDSSTFEPGPGPACEGPLGGYALPKRVLTAVVKEAEVKGSKRRLRTIEVGAPEAIPDPRLFFCLNYLASGFSEDAVAVSRTTTGLLNRVYSRVADKSKAIASSVLDVVGIGATGNPAFAGGLRSRRAQIAADAATIAYHKFDPFDRQEAARINAELSDLGFCVYVDGATFDRGVNPDAYCAAPKRFAGIFPPGPVFKTPAQLIAQEQVPAQAAKMGILYRPNLRYELTVKRRLEPDLPGAWLVVETRQVEMPNEAPVFSLQVERSLFVTRKADIVFDKGTLLDVTADRPSELAEFIDIPLQAVQAVFAIPAQIVQVRINRANNEERLIRAQAALIQTMRNYKLEMAGVPRSAVVAENAVTGEAATPRSMPNQETRDEALVTQVHIDLITKACGNPQFNTSSMDTGTCRKLAQYCVQARIRDNPTECVIDVTQPARR